MFALYAPVYFLFKFYFFLVIDYTQYSAVLECSLRRRPVILNKQILYCKICVKYIYKIATRLAFKEKKSRYAIFREN